MNSQNNLSYFNKIINSSSNNINFESVIDSLILDSKNAHKYDEVIQIAHSYSLKLYKQNYLNKAIKYSEIEIRVYEKLNKLNNKYCNALYNLGNFYFKNNDLKKTISTVDKALILNIEFVKKPNSYSLIARCLYNLGERYKSIIYYEKSIALFEKAKKHKYLFQDYISLANLYHDLSTKESISKSKLLLDKSDAIKNNFVPTDYDLYRLNYHFAFYYNQVSNFEKTKYYYSKNLISGLAQKDSVRIATIYTSLADLYNTKKKDSASIFLNNALKYATNSKTKSPIYHTYFDYYMHKNLLKDALTSIQKSINLEANTNDNFEATPILEEIKNSPNKYHLITILEKKAIVLLKLYEKENNKKYVHYALGNLLLVESLISDSESISVEENTKLFWRSEASILYYYLAYCYEILNDFKNYFNCFEKNKASLLLQNIKDNLSSSNDLNNEILSLKKELFLIEKNISNEADSLKRKKLNNIYFTKKTKQYSLLDSLKKESKTINKPIKTITDIKIIQQELDANSAVISYLWEKEQIEFNYIFGILILKNNVKIFKINDKKKTQKLINNFKTLLSKPFDKKSSTKNYKEIAYKLYSKLFPKEIQDLIINKNLIIIPDSDLQSIPFEALITNKETNNYLIKNHEISYAYSMSFMYENSNLERQAKGNLISFAPLNFEYNELQDLKFSALEVNSIQDIIRGKKFLENNATKSNFFKSSSDYKIIHLATHANANDSITPWIAFKNERLELFELYTYKNQADLVFLSACNSSLGNTKTGEGIFSLARGFFYSGANSVISSLWNVNDKSTQQISSSFYKNLKSGSSKSHALRQAKLDYLNTHSLSGASPYYWSTLILIGDNSPIEFAKNNYWIYILCISVFLLCFFIFLKKRKI